MENTDISKSIYSNKGNGLKIVKKPGPAFSFRLPWSAAVILVLILIGGNLFFGWQYFALQKELKEAKFALGTEKTNEKVLNFAKLFVEKVLKAEGEVNFDDRLKLENAIRDLGDEEILKQWQRFVDSKTEQEAQNEVKNLLEMLVKKIK